MASCHSVNNEQQQLIGEWKAHWETGSNESLPNVTNKNLKMNGLMKFMDNGQVEVLAYGYEGCVFSNDTLKNMLSWKLDNSILRFIDGDDENGLPYDILKFSNTEMKLTLLEDINLTLRKN